MVDLFCLGVKNTTWFFNTDADEIEQIIEDTDRVWLEIPYALAHNIVYAGLAFAEEYHIKPHVDFGIAKYALDEDDDAIELIDIETGDDGIPHLIESHPGQHADALGKLKKYAGPGNYKTSLAIFTDDSDDEAEDSEYDEDWEEDDFEGDEEISLKDIEADGLTIYNASMLIDEELFDTQLIKTRNEIEQLIIYVEGSIRIYESLSLDPGFITQTLGMDESVEQEIVTINELTAEDCIGNLAYPNGCDEDEYEAGMEDFLSLIEKMPHLELKEKASQLKYIIQNTGEHNPLVLTQCICYLMVDSHGSKLYEMLQPYIHSMQQYPLVALAQTFFVTAEPELFSHEPLLTGSSPILHEVFDEYASFSEEEFTLLYALRCLQAAKQENMPLMATWYRKLTIIDSADVFVGMIPKLNLNMMKGVERFLKKVEKFKDKK